MERHPRQSVTAYVFSFLHGEPRFLTLMKTPRSRLGGAWQGVHGSIRDRERAFDAAFREVREQTGLVPDRFFRVEYVEVFYQEDTDAIHTIPVFAAHVPSLPRPQLGARHTDFEWCHLDETLARLQFATQRHAVSIIARAVSPWPEVEADLRDITGYLGS